MADNQYLFCYNGVCDSKLYNVVLISTHLPPKHITLLKTWLFKYRTMTYCSECIEIALNIWALIFQEICRNFILTFYLILVLGRKKNCSMNLLPKFCFNVSHFIFLSLSSNLLIRLSCHLYGTQLELLQRPKLQGGFHIFVTTIGPQMFKKMLLSPHSW